jgi:Rrf2 family protein
MFKINKDVEYALIAMQAMAERGVVISARELADRYQIPSGILAKILQRLSHEGMVTSVQGPKGGYRMNGSPEEITLGQVIDAVHGPERIVPCIEEPGTCGQEQTCIVRHGFEAMQGLWVGYLNSLTLSRFAELNGFGSIPVS